MKANKYYILHMHVDIYYYLIIHLYPSICNMICLTTIHVGGHQATTCIPSFTRLLAMGQVLCEPLWSHLDCQLPKVGREPSAILDSTDLKGETRPIETTCRLLRASNDTCSLKFVDDL